MDSLLKLKLDMVYREIPMEEAKQRFEELKPKPLEPVPEPEPEPEPVKPPVRKRKVVKPLLPKSK